LSPLKHAHKYADAQTQKDDPEGYAKAMIMAINFYTGLKDHEGKPQKKASSKVRLASANALSKNA
jgi:hypothetical protein